MYSQDFSFDRPTPPPNGSKQAKRWYKRWWGVMILVLLAIFLSISIAIGFYVGKVVLLLRSGEVSPEKIFGQELVKKNRLALATEDDPSFGRRDSKVVIVEFADFQCSACQSAYPVVKKLSEDYKDKILFVFRDFPVVADHPASLLAAMAASCANEQGKFWEMYGKIFENQADITELSLKTHAIQLGLNSVEFGDCIQSGKYLKEIEQDLNDGYEAGVRATPTFFINGLKIEGAIPLQIFEKFISAELSL